MKIGLKNESNNEFYSSLKNNWKLIPIEYKMFRESKLSLREKD